jgi:hypothetical protein
MQPGAGEHLELVAEIARRADVVSATAAVSASDDPRALDRSASQRATGVLPAPPATRDPIDTTGMGARSRAWAVDRERALAQLATATGALSSMAGVVLREGAKQRASAAAFVPRPAVHSERGAHRVREVAREHDSGRPRRRLE